MAVNPNTLELLRVIIPSVIVAVGWFVVSNDQNRRETRKEQRQFLDRTVETIESIRDAAQRYCCEQEPVAAGKLELELDTKLFRLETSLKHLALKKKDKQSIDALRFRTSITQNPNYRSRKRVAMEPTDLAIYSMCAESQYLINELEKAYKRKYQ